jgi:SAM-dependent methyltransferase
MKMDYKDFHDYYAMRANVIGIEDGQNSFVFWLMKDIVRDHLKIIDIGCGRGLMLRPLSRINPSVVGYDISSANVELCKSNGLNVVQCDCVEKIPEACDSVDLAVCTELLEHLADVFRTKLVSNIRSCLKPGGLLLAAVPYKENFPANLCVCPNCKAVFHRFGHVQEISEDELLDLMKNMGFSVLESVVAYPQLRRYRMPFFIWKFFSKLRLNKSGQLIVIAKKTLSEVPR